MIKRRIWPKPAAEIESHRSSSFIFGQHRLGLVLALAALLVATNGCGGPSRDIIGKWRTSGDSSAMVWEFSKNGSFLMGEVRGKYSLGSNNRLKIETPYAISIYQMEFFGDRLFLRDPNGSKLEFTKIKEARK